MAVIELTAWEEVARVPGPVGLALGVFDGLHRGHQAVLAAAGEGGRSVVVVTFEPHPLAVLRPGEGPARVLSRRHFAVVLERLGVGWMLVLPFTREFAAQPAEVFAGQLAAVAGAEGLVAVGEDWRFGHRAGGDVALLRARGLNVAAVPAVRDGGATISSTRIREAVGAGELADAARWLGRPYAVLGAVTRGRQLARQLGFPTANLATLTEPLPPSGVYAVRVRHGARCDAGVANLGWRPTVEDAAPARQLEVHLFDFDGDLYDAELEVEFHAWLRPERKFASLEALKEQMGEDAAGARRILSV